MIHFSAPWRQKIFFAFLYFCEGAPIGFIWWMLPTQLRTAGVSVEKITLLTSLLVLPWAFKFLWAPVVDSIQSRRWNVQSWIIASQAMMIVSLTPLLVLDAATQFSWIFLSLLVHTVAAATQDVAIDALCIATVKETEQGSVNGWMQFGMLTGRSAFGGIALVAASFVGPRTILITMMAIILMATIIVSRMTFSTNRETPNGFTETWQALRSVLRGSTMWYGLAFAVLGGFAYEGVGIVAGPFLVDRNIPSVQIGYFFSFVSVSAMMLGALAGGRFCDRFGKRRMAGTATLLTVAAALMVAAADLIGQGMQTTLLLTALTVLYGTIGLFTSSTYALFMSLTDHRLGATQFSTFMGGTNLCESLAGFTAGKLIAAVDYPAAFSLLAVVSVVSLLFLRKLPNHHPPVQSDEEN